MEFVMAVWLRLTMLAWVTAVLAVAPVQAALACRDCCVQLARSKPAAPQATMSCCVHHKTASDSCCTQTSATKNSQPLGQPCGECPRCEQARPLPVAPIPAGPQLLDLAAVAVFDIPLTDLSPQTCAASMTDAASVASSSHQLCAQLCRWLT